MGLVLRTLSTVGTLIEAEKDPECSIGLEGLKIIDDFIYKVFLR